MSKMSFLLFFISLVGCDIDVDRVNNTKLLNIIDTKIVDLDPFYVEIPWGNFKSIRDGDFAGNIAIHNRSLREIVIVNHINGSILSSYKYENEGPDAVDSFVDFNIDVNNNLVCLSYLGITIVNKSGNVIKKITFNDDKIKSELKKGESLTYCNPWQSSSKITAHENFYYYFITKQEVDPTSLSFLKINPYTGEMERILVPFDSDIKKYESFSFLSNILSPQLNIGAKNELLINFCYSSKAVIFKKGQSTKFDLKINDLLTPPKPQASVSELANKLEDEATIGILNEFPDAQKYILLKSNPKDDSPERDRKLYVYDINNPSLKPTIYQWPDNFTYDIFQLNDHYVAIDRRTNSDSELKLVFFSL